MAPVVRRALVTSAVALLVLLLIGATYQGVATAFERRRFPHPGRLVDVGRVDELGGAEARVPIVRWREPDGTPREARTERPAELVASVVAAHGGEPDALEVIRPSLEDIYLRLVHAAGADAHDDEEALA